MNAQLGSNDVDEAPKILQAAGSSAPKVAGRVPREEKQ